MEKVMEYARQFCPPQQGGEGRRPHQARGADAAGRCPLESALALERELQQLLFQSEDAKEGLGAYVGKRKPEFRGK